MVNIDSVLETLYKGACSITEYRPKLNLVNKRTEHGEVVVYNNIPCRLSFETIKSSDESSTVNSVSQITKLFLSSKYNIKPGSKITVTQNEITTKYQSSGKPAVYSSHQEIILKLFEGWA
jgi:hypothetical protein